MTIPNPGSAEAVSQGCKCPVLDNNHGKGLYFDTERNEAAFWIDAGCPIHGDPSWRPEPPKEKVDLFIPAAPKDYNKIPYVVKHAVENIDISDVHIVTPHDLPFNIDVPNKVYYWMDQDVLEFDRSKFNFRHGWMFQQMLKLCQQVTSANYYICIDADMILLRDQPTFYGDHPVLLLGLDQEHKPYFDFNEKLYGFRRIYPHSFLSEATLYNKELVEEMRKEIGCNSPEEFAERIAKESHNGLIPGDAELWGNWVMARYPGLYTTKQMKVALGGRYGGRLWDNSEIEQMIEQKYREGADAATVHSWEGG